jgi:hypothetical protein
MVSSLSPELAFAQSFVSVSVYFVDVMIRTEDGGRQTALENRVRAHEPGCVNRHSMFVIRNLAFEL